MPLFLLIPLLAGGAGFAGGFFAGGGVKTIGRIVVIGGVAYVIYKAVK